MATPVVETINPAHRNGSGGARFIAAVIRAQVDGVEGRFLITFVPEHDPNTGNLVGAKKDPREGVLAFVVHLDEAASGNIERTLRGETLFNQWLPALQQAYTRAADDRRRSPRDPVRAAEVAQLNSMTDATIRDALTRLGMEWTPEVDAAARRVIWPGMTQLEDKELPDFKTAVERELVLPQPQ